MKIKQNITKQELFVSLQTWDSYVRNDTASQFTVITHDTIYKVYEQDSNKYLGRFEQSELSQKLLNNPAKYKYEKCELLDIDYALVENKTNTPLDLVKGLLTYLSNNAGLNANIKINDFLKSTCLDEDVIRNRLIAMVSQKLIYCPAGRTIGNSEAGRGKNTLDNTNVSASLLVDGLELYTRNYKSSDSSNDLVKEKFEDEEKTIVSNSTNIMKEKLKGLITQQIDSGISFQTRIQKIGNTIDLDILITDYNLWNENNKLILEKGFVQSFQQFFRMYSGIDYLSNMNIQKDSFEYKRDNILNCLPKQIAQLRTVLAYLEQASTTILLPINEQEIINSNKKTKNSMKKIFISHSSLDSNYVGELINLIEGIGITHNQIFCSSFEGYGVELGEDFLDRLKKELDEDILVFFILTQNFYNSPISLCEMGATWIKTNKHIPILIPPFDFKDVKGVFPVTNGMKINDKNKLNSLKETLENDFSLTQ